jgi:hypothetical protein
MRISDRKGSSCEVVKVEEDWEEENEMDLYEEENEEEIEKIEDEIDEICSRVTSCEDCPWEICGDLCEIICEDEEEELEEDMEDLYVEVE